jgi:hypothetical protein
MAAGIASPLSENDAEASCVGRVAAGTHSVRVRGSDLAEQQRDLVFGSKLLPLDQLRAVLRFRVEVAASLISLQLDL